MDWHVKGKVFFYDDMVVRDDDGSLTYDFIIESDDEPNVSDIARTIGENAINLLPFSTNDRPTRGD